MMRPTCCIIGAGNVATHLARALAHFVDVRQVFSRNIDHAEAVASSVGAEAIDSLDRLIDDADFYIISVADDAIPDVVNRTSAIDHGTWLHTSGSTAMDVLASKPRHGVLYPMQTFTRSRDVDFKTIDLFIESDSATTMERVKWLADNLSDKVTVADSALRTKIHVAAVFACNFVNFMFTQADEILRSEGLGIEVLKPLIAETVAKIGKMSPENAQTGPARRGDIAILERHLATLDPEKARLYQLISEQIIKKYHEQD